MRDWRNRLENWKFRQALLYLPSDHPHYEVVERLARLYEDSGWFDGIMGDLVGYLVDMILKEQA